MKASRRRCSPPTQQFTFNYSGRIQHFDLYAGGVGSESSETYDRSFTWSLDGSTIRIMYEAPVVTFSWDSQPVATRSPSTGSLCDRRRDHYLPQLSHRYHHHHE